jgi:hypothetical protein
MSQTVEITSINFSGQQANVIFTPDNSDISYGLGIKTIPFTFDSSIIGDNILVIGKYSINILNSNCSYVLVIN